MKYVYLREAITTEPTDECSLKWCEDHLITAHPQPL